jgi:DNA repair exonuclease SbcCD ATPase subunit
MRLSKIELESYRNHAHSVIEIGGASFIVFRGPNHAGKSSIREAISMGLALTTSSLDPQGRNFTRKIKRGSDKGVVKLDIQGNHLIQQVVTLNTNTTGRTVRSTCIDDPDWRPLPFDNFLERFKDALLVAANTDYFLLRMDENRQKSLLAKLALPERYDFPEEIVQGVVKALGEGAIKFDGEPFAVIAQAYKKLYEERAVVNRQVKDFVIPEKLPIVTGVDSDSLQKKLGEARAERQNIESEKDAAVKAAGDVEVKRAKMTTKMDGLKERCIQLSTRIKEIENALLPDEQIDSLKIVAKRKEEHDKIVTRLSELDTKITDARKEWEAWKSLGTDLLRCPKCEQPITKEYVESNVSGSLAVLENAKSSHAELLTELKALGDVDGAVASIAKQETDLREKATLQKTLDDTIKEGRELRKDVDALGPAVNAAAQYGDPLEAVDKKINWIVEELRPVIAAEERVKEIKTKTEALEVLQKQASRLDELVKYFDKDGIKAKLLAEHIGGFENKLNETLGAFGYKCALSIEPYEMQVTNTAGDTILTTELSDSEQLMFSVALQCAVSRVAGIGFIVADRMDTFLPEERKKANRCLYMMATDKILEQVIMVLSDESTEVPNLPGSAFFFVNKGTVKRLE